MKKDHQWIDFLFVIYVIMMSLDSFTTALNAQYLSSLEVNPLFRWGPTWGFGLAAVLNLLVLWAIHRVIRRRKPLGSYFVTMVMIAVIMIRSAAIRNAVVLFSHPEIAQKVASVTTSADRAQIAVGLTVTVYSVMAFSILTFLVWYADYRKQLVIHK